MSYIRDTVFILKSEPFREHDSRVTMYGRTHGKLVAVARGSRRMAAKHLGHLEPLSVAEVMIAPGATFDKLAVARRVSVMPLGLGAVALSGAFASLLDSLIEPGIPEPALYELLTEARNVFGEESDVTPARARFLLAGTTLRLLDALGYAPPTEDRLLKFMRRARLEDLKRLTAPLRQLTRACEFVEDALRRTPLAAEPHGPATVTALLS